MYRVSSGVSISDLGIQQIKEAEEILQKEIGPEYGFDVKQIGRLFEFLGVKVFIRLYDSLVIINIEEA